MPIAITTQSKSPFVLEADRDLPEAQRTEFDLAPPTITQRAELAKLFISAQDNPVEQLQVAIQTCMACVRGWRRFQRADGTAVEFVSTRRNVLGVIGDYVTEDALSALDMTHAKELAVEAWSRARLGSDDEGK